MTDISSNSIQPQTSEAHFSAAGEKNATSKEFIEKVLGSLNDHFVMFDHEWRYTYVNDAAARMIGRPKEELVGHIIWELFPNAVGNQYYQELHGARATGKDTCFEHYYQPWDGWFENRIYALADGISVLTIDITARKKAEEAQRQSEQMLAFALQAAKMVAWEWDIERDTITTSNAYDHIFDLPPVHTAAEGFARVHPDDALHHRQQIEKAIATGTPYQSEFRIIRPNSGEVVWVEEWGFAVPNAEGVVQKLFGVEMESSDRKRSEQALRESEERFRNLADSAPVMIWMTDADGNTIYLNQQWYNFTGDTPGDEADFDWMKAVHPDDLQNAEDAFIQGHHSGKPFRQEYRLCRRDGIYCWGIDSAIPRYGKNGEFLGYIGSIIDITERKEAEERLQVIHQLSEAVNRAEAVEQIYDLALSGLERVFHVGRASILLADPQGVMRYQAWRGISEHYREQTDGQSPRSINEANPVPVLIPDVAKAELPGQKQLILDEGIQAMGFIPLVEERRLLGKFMLYYDQPHEFSDTEVQWAQTIARHLAHALDRKQAQLRLQSYTHTLEELNRIQLSLAGELDLQNLLQMVTNFSTELSGAQFGAFFYNVTNEAGNSYMLYTLAGVPHEAFEHFPMPRSTEIFGPTFRGECVIRLADVTLDPRFGNNSPYYGLPPGHLPIRSYLAVPVISIEGDVIGGLFFGHSHPGVFTEQAEQLVSGIASQAAILIANAQLYAQVTERETALRELNATLEHHVEKRTAELQRSNRELDQFAYVASHDLKAPLRAINHLASWIAQDAAEILPTASQEHLTKLQGRVRRMETLLDDLLAYSRAGRQRHPAEQVDTTELIHSVIDILTPPPNFTVKISGKLPVMRVERTPLETVFRNLIGNAIKHHHLPAGGVVEISAQDQGDFVEFAVSDNGPGIDPTYHQRIFEMFQTLQPRDQVEGSGVGLAVVKKFIESRGGTIQVESNLGQGATFRFTWPKSAATMMQV